MTKKSKKLSDEEFDFESYQKQVVAGLMEGKGLLGEDGLLKPLIARFVETAMDAELDHHLSEESKNPLNALIVLLKQNAINAVLNHINPIGLNTGFVDFYSYGSNYSSEYKKIAKFLFHLKEYYFSVYKWREGLLVNQNGALILKTFQLDSRFNLEDWQFDNNKIAVEHFNRKM